VLLETGSKPAQRGRHETEENALRRLGQWAALAHLGAEVLVNPEFASVSEARTAATHYARMLGRLPRFLRLYVYRVEIHQGTQAWSATPCNSETLYLGTPCTCLL